MRRNFENVPKEVWDELRLRTIEFDLEYADNFRAYRTSAGMHKQDFLRAYNNGCCGYYEGGITHNSEKWVVGCNYGH